MNKYIFPCVRQCSRRSADDWQRRRCLVLARLGHHPPRVGRLRGQERRRHRRALQRDHLEVRWGRRGGVDCAGGTSSGCRTARRSWPNTASAGTASGSTSSRRRPSSRGRAARRPSRSPSKRCVGCKWRRPCASAKIVGRACVAANALRRAVCSQPLLARPRWRPTSRRSSARSLTWLAADTALRTSTRSIASAGRSSSARSLTRAEGISNHTSLFHTPTRKLECVAATAQAQLTAAGPCSERHRCIGSARVAADDRPLCPRP